MACKSKTNIPLLVFAQLLLLVLLLSTTEAKVPAVIVFGDSTMDAGNNNQVPTIVRSNFPPYGRDFVGKKATGRFSNGRLVSDFISEAFGLKPSVPAYLDPNYNIADFAVGVSFASAGSGYDNATSDLLSVIPLWKEVEYYKEYQQKLRASMGETEANGVLTDALYLTSLGTNDFLENYYTLRQRRNQYTIEQYQGFLVTLAENFIRELYSLGARKISLGGIPPMGCLPLERMTNFMNGYACVDSYNQLSLDFNGKLKDLTLKLNRELPGIRVVHSNPYPILMQIIKKPTLFGFDVVSTSCCGTGTFEMGYQCDQYNPFSCSDASKYVFWDAFHPTDKTNRIIADHLVKTALAQFL